MESEAKPPEIWEVFENFCVESDFTDTACSR